MIRRASGRFALPALVEFAAIEAVMDDDALIFRRVTPARADGMFPEIADGIDVASVDLPKAVLRRSGAR